MPWGARATSSGWAAPTGVRARYEARYLPGQGLHLARDEPARRADVVLQAWGPRVPTWTNWVGNQPCSPAEVAAPSSEDEVAEPGRLPFPAESAKLPVAKAADSPFDLREGGKRALLGIEQDAI